MGVGAEGGCGCLVGQLPSEDVLPGEMAAPHQSEKRVRMMK